VHAPTPIEKAVFAGVLVAFGAPFLMYLNELSNMWTRAEEGTVVVVDDQDEGEKGSGVDYRVLLAFRGSSCPVSSFHDCETRAFDDVERVLFFFYLLVGGALAICWVVFVVTKVCKKNIQIVPLYKDGFSSYRSFSLI